MDNILDWLEYQTQPDPWPPEYFALVDQTDPYSDAILEHFSMSFLDGLTDALCEISKWERQEAFSRGFRLGVQLTLEGLQPSD